MIYLANAFSLNMLDSKVSYASVSVQRVATGDVVRKLAHNFTSVIGHAQTAAILEDILGMSVPVNRVSLKMTPGDMLIVAQFSGERMPEGATKLPEGSRLEFMVVRVEHIAEGSPFDSSSEDY